MTYFEKYDKFDVFVTVCMRSERGKSKNYFAFTEEGKRSTRIDAEAKQDNTLRNQATLTRCYRTTRC